MLSTADRRERHGVATVIKIWNFAKMKDQAFLQSGFTPDWKPLDICTLCFGGFFGFHHVEEFCDECAQRIDVQRDASESRCHWSMTRR